MVGAGPSGLAAAASLVQRGEVSVVVLERQGSVQGGWCQHFDGLTITTRASACGLPGFPMKLFTSADELTPQDYVGYLHAYVARFALEVRCATEVVQAEHCHGEWHLCCRDGGGRATRLTCRELVVATGKNAIPRVPQLWAERPMVLHSSQLQGERFHAAVSAASEGRLLLVGFGNSAADICSLLLARAPSAKVHVSMRRLPPIVRRQWGPLRLEWFASLFACLCNKNGDRFTTGLMYLIEGDIRPLFPGLPTWGARQERHIPTVDRDGSLLQMVRAQRILPHPDVESVEFQSAGVAVRFAGHTAQHDFSLVVLCTGYEASREAQSGLFNDAVQARAHFVGLGPEPADLLPLRGIGRESRQVGMGQN